MLKAALRDEVDKRGHSHREAGDAMDTTQQTVSNWIAGRTVPSPSSYPSIARYLKVSRTAVRAMANRQRAESDPFDRLTEQVAVLAQRVDELERRVD